MSYNLEIWRAVGGGVTDADFALLTTQPNATVGAEFDYPDGSAAPGSLCAYRSRYVCAADASIVSPWSPIAFARAPYPTQPIPRGKITMGCGVTTNAQTQVGIGVERFYGQPVQAAYGADVLTSDLSVQVERAVSNAHRNTPSAVSDETPAASTVSGNMTFDLRPDGASLRLLLAHYAIDTTYTQTLPAVGNVGQPGYIAQRFVYKLIPSFTEQPVTIIDKQGTSAFVYSGGKGNTLTIDLDKQAKTPIRAVASYMGLNCAKFPSVTANDLALLGLNALGYSVNKYGPTDWALFIAGVQSGDCRKFTHSFNRNLQAKEVGDFTLGAQCHYADTSAVQPTSESYWTTDGALKAWWGQLPGVADPYGVSKAIITSEVRVSLRPPAASNGVVYQFDIVYPLCSVSNLAKPKAESGAIMQNLTYTPRQDPANNFIDHYLLVTTTESLAVIQAPQQEIAPFPATAMHGYNAVPGVIAAGTSATVFTLAPNVYLSAVDGSYVGLQFQFVTGNLKGQYAQVTGYIAATRQITVATPFTAAPAAGDSGIVIGAYGIP